MDDEFKESIVNRIIVNKGSNFEEEMGAMTSIKPQNSFHALSSNYHEDIENQMDSDEEEFEDQHLHPVRDKTSLYLGSESKKKKKKRKQKSNRK